MKNILLSIACVFLLLPVKAQLWLGYSLQTDTGAAGVANSSIGLIYQGQFFSTPIEIAAATKSINRSSPELLLRSWLWAMNNADGQVYNELFATNKLAQQFANDVTLKINKALLKRKFYYGDFCICQLEINFSRTGISMPFTNAAVLFPLQKRGSEYFASEGLLADRGYNLFSFYYDVSALYGIPAETALQPDFNQPGFIFETNYPSGSVGQNPSIIFRISGQNFTTNVVLTNWPTQNSQDLSSPTGVLAAAVSALNLNDVEWYSSLLHPDDKTNAVHYGWNVNAGRSWDSIMRDQFKVESGLKRPTSIRLVKKIIYSEGIAALIYENAFAPIGAQRDILYFRRSGTYWYISHTMEERGVQLSAFYGFGTFANTKLFPHFDPSN